ncbi:MAG: hypothetical protein HZA49_01885 [Planctomycetes bacterium]|nr:hypothetical protein [Planctomycetota bacterium]
MSYQTCWQEKVKKLPEEIFTRFEKVNNQSTPKRALLVGKGIELLLPNLNRFLGKSEWKLFISQAEDGCVPCCRETGISSDNSETPPDNLVYLKGGSDKCLSSFPAEIFDLVFSLWDLPSQSQSNIFYTDNLYRLVKKGGKVSVITYLDGSPELPLDVIKRIIRRKKLPLKIFKSALPDSTGNLRKMLNKTGFGDVRIWKSSIACAYQSAEDLHNDIFSDGEGNLFMADTTDEQRIFVKEEFIKEASAYSFPLEISYDFAGGVGVKP